MRYSIFYKKSATTELLDLPSSVAHRIKAAIDNLSENPRPSGCLKLKGSLSDYCLRIGKYRIIYTLQDDILVVNIIKISHRKKVYR